MIDKLVLKTQEEIRTMTDPYRIDIIQILKKNKVLTVKEIAEILNQPHGKVYYHVQKLFKLGALYIEHTEKINGIVAKYYALNFKSMEIQSQSDELNASVKLSHASTMVNKFYEDSKKEFLDYIQHAPEFREKLGGKLEDHKGQLDSVLQLTELYFTEDTYEPFIKELNSLIDKYTMEQKVEGEFVKSLFLTIHNLQS